MNTQRTRGRPRKPAGQKLQQIEVSFSPDQVQALRDLSTKLDRPVSSIVREIVTERLQRLFPSDSPA